MKANQKNRWILDKTHLLIINLILTFLVILVYVANESTVVKGIAIGLYVLSLWIMFSIKGIQIWIEEEETEDELQ